LSFWGWLFGGEGKSLRVTLNPDEGGETYDRIWSRKRFRALVLLPVLGLAALLLLVLGAGTLLMEKRHSRELEHRLEESRQQASRLEGLEAQLRETEALLLKLGNMVGAAELLPDSLSGGEGAALAEAAPSPREGLKRGEMEMLRSLPSAWPLHGWTTQEFRAEHGPGHHPGIDIAVEEGTPVRAAGAGAVLVAGWNDEYGNFVILDHGFVVTSLYGHNSHLAVRKEDRVEQGDIIAYSGSTGRSTAPHLHFEIRRNGIAEDPKKYLLD